MDAIQKITESLIITGGNPPILLQLGKEVCNQVSPAILVSVELPGAFDWTSVESLLPLVAAQSDTRALLLQLRQCLPAGSDLIQKGLQQHVRTLQCRSWA